MSATFFNLRRRQAALKAQAAGKAESKAKAAAPADKPSDKPKKGRVKTDAV